MWNKGFILIFALVVLSIVSFIILQILYILSFLVG
ncbi:Hypothetical Protein CTN_0480 [Thermotoga neapolitana DSM 4359]|uniref:Uncharacterized protein n=1 Tax=Thermotoga neapolitana (strain ATCC 49049 / DSM 4359 / NBRC 107923 / NS-E) TaxID=309803 RepID=B9K6S3_THENN|nr:Hypothetical Protein CTN_0480 [Thermotoga neapolitana DSM 4359]